MTVYKPNQFKGCPVIEINGVPQSKHGLLRLIGGQEGCVGYLPSFGTATNIKIHLRQNRKKHVLHIAIVWHRGLAHIKSDKWFRSPRQPYFLKRWHILSFLIYWTGKIKLLTLKVFQNHSKFFFWKNSKVTRNSIYFSISLRWFHLSRLRGSWQKIK